MGSVMTRTPVPLHVINTTSVVTPHGRLRAASLLLSTALAVFVAHVHTRQNQITSPLGERREEERKRESEKTERVSQSERTMSPANHFHARTVDAT